MRQLLTHVFTSAMMLTLAAVAQALPLHKASDLGTARERTSLASPKAGGVLPLRTQGRNTLAKRTPLSAPRHTSYRAPLRAPETFPQLNGVVVYSDAWGGADNTGMYSIPMTSDSEVELLGMGVPCATSGACVQDGVFYTQSAMDVWGVSYGIALLGYDPETWEEVSKRDFNPDLETYYSVGRNPVDGLIYGVTMSVDETTGASTLYWSHVDFAASTVEHITPVDYVYTAIGFANDGTCYGVTNMEQEGKTVTMFGTIDKANGVFTPMSKLPYVCEYRSSGCMDQRSGRFFVNIARSADAYMLEIDPATGNVLYEYMLPAAEEIMALYVPQPSAEDGAPDMCTDLKLDFPRGTLSGNVCFTMPSTLFDGTPAQGEVEYVVMVNDEEAAVGRAAYGAEVTQAVQVSTPSNCRFAVYCRNDVGDGPKTKASMYVGNDVPILQNVKASYENGQFTVTWDPVAPTGFNGGFVDTDQVTYDVVLFPDEEEVALGTKETSVTVPYQKPEEISVFYFTVCANCNGLFSDEAMTNSVIVGSINPPYTQNFADKTSLDLFTVIDANGDGTTWTWDAGGMARAGYAMSKMNDWLVTPPIAMKAGNAYRFSCRAYGSGARYPERIEVKWGDKATVQSLRNTLVGPTEVKTTGREPEDAVEISGWIKPQADGDFYVGLHGISDANMFNLYVDDIEVGAGVDRRAPAAPQLEIIPDADGALRVEARVTPSTVDFDGNPVDDNMIVTLWRNGEYAGGREDVAPGTTVTLLDEPSKGGMTTYSVVCENGYGEGPAATATVFVGVDAPAAPSNVKLVETQNGCVKLTWDAVDKGVNGVTIKPQDVKYTILDADGNVVAQNLTDCQWEARAVPEGQQGFPYYGVYGVNTGGNGAVATSPMIAAGEVSQTPYYESGAMTHPVGMCGDGADWGIGNDLNPDAPSSDGDNAFFLCTATAANSHADLMLPKMDLAPLGESPAVSFMLYNFSDILPGYNNSVSVLVTCEGETEEVETMPASDLKEPGWGRVTVRLDQYAGKQVQITLRGNVGSYVYIFLDDIRVFSQAAANLTAESLAAPAAVTAGQEFEVKLTVANNGAETAAEGAYTVTFYLDGQLLEQQAGTRLYTDEKAVFTCPCRLNPMSEPLSRFTAKVEWSQDVLQADNEAEPAVTLMRMANLPTATLSGDHTNAGNVLTWQAPDLENAPETVTEDFENAPSWGDCPEGWTVIDNDQHTVGGFNQGITIPGWDKGQGKGTWKVFDYGDTEVFQFPDNFKPLSGDKYMASIYAIDGANDEWLISPELYGGKQTISFWARSLEARYGQEKVRVLYSTTGTDIDDFVEVEMAPNTTVPLAWTEFVANLPEGAKYFAINHVSDNVFMLMVDDVTYLRAGHARGLEVKGYNVYRDGQLLTQVQGTTFTDTDSEGQHRYAVTVAYATGESSVSNILVLDSTPIGIGAVDSESAPADAYNLQGILVMRQATAAQLRQLPAGIYIHGGRKVKVDRRK